MTELMTELFAGVGGVATGVAVIRLLMALWSWLRRLRTATPTQIRDEITELREMIQQLSEQNLKLRGMAATLPDRAKGEL